MALLSATVYPNQMVFRLGAEPLSKRSVNEIHEDCEEGEGNNAENPFRKGISKQNISLPMLARGMIVLLAFFIPLSTAITLILTYAILLVWLIDKNAYARWQFYFSYPLIKPIAFFILVSSLGTLYSMGSEKATLAGFYHGLRLSLIPVLAYYLQEEQSKYKDLVMYAFVCALIVTVICAFLKVYAGIPIGARTYGNDVFKDHIIISYFMAISIFFAYMWFLEEKLSKELLILLMGLMLYHLIFLNTGRIGFVILYICFSVLAWHRYRFKGILITYLLLSLVMLCAYQYSDIFSMRMNEFYQEFKLYLQGKAVSSIGTRLEWATNSLKLFFEHPIIGFGTGSYKHSYAVYYAGQVEKLADNPHNQYLKMAVEHGMIGVVVLGWLFYSQWKLVQQLKGSNLILGQSIFLSFFIGCLFNSWLKDVSEFHFYCLMTAFFIPCIQKLKN